MADILIEHNPSPMKLEVLGAEDWPVRREPVCVREKSCAHTQTTFILRGRAEITPAGGQPVAVGRGDLVTFLPGTRCTWNITEAMERHCQPIPLNEQTDR